MGLPRCLVSNVRYGVRFCTFSFVSRTKAIHAGDSCWYNNGCVSGMKKCMRWIASCSPDTVYAVSTAAGKSAVAIVRLSGPESSDVLKSFMAVDRRLPDPRMATLTTLYHPLSKVVLDKAICLWFPAHQSATGEDVVEFHLHGAPTVVRAVMDTLGTIQKLRPADPGEFSRRAFHNGRMDLTEIEGLADVMAAETEAQRVQAVASAGGATRRHCELWRSALLRSLARVEAVIDFGEDEEIAENVAEGVIPHIVKLREDLEAHLVAASGSELIRQGIKVAILGAPNAGKSSLCNTLAGRNIAIVSDIPGTTRDILEVSLDLGGHKVILSDAAGIRNLHASADNAIELEGIRRAYRVAREAHIIVHLREPDGYWIDIDDSLTIDGNSPSLGSNIKEKESEDMASTSIPARKIMRVVNKADLMTNPPNKYTNNVDSDCKISCRTGEGLDGFILKLTELVDEVIGDVTAKHTGAHDIAVPILNRARHKQHIEDCIRSLKRYETIPMNLDIAAEELRAAAVSLGHITGAIDTEAVLDSIFSEFCIGK